ncbi:putative FCP1 domain, HAD superfamily protein [Helianthus annuus]|nr:putative FCP1 domain, HAD superfamily protein [Helianthus annuus]
MMNNNPDLGDMLSTRESMHEGLSTTKVFEVKSGETVFANTATLDANIVSNGDHADVSGKAGESETTKLNVNGKEKKKRKPKSKNKRPTLGEILNPLYLQNLEAAKTGSGTISTDNRASKKHKRQRLNGKSDVGDILSTHESTHEGLSTTKGDHLEVVKGKKKKKPKSKNNETGLESTDIESIASPQVANSEMGSTTIVLKEITHVATLGKKLIILDVNGLLADVLTERPKDIVADKYLPRRAIFKRPYLDDFLCFCFERFEVGIWSSRAMKNLVPVINFLLGDLKKKLLFLWVSAFRLCYICQIQLLPLYQYLGDDTVGKYYLSPQIFYRHSCLYCNLSNH